MFIPILCILARIHNNPVSNNIRENVGNPDHMIIDAVDDVEACLQMATISWCFGILRFVYGKKMQFVFLSFSNNTFLCVFCCCSLCFV